MSAEVPAGSAVMTAALPSAREGTAAVWTGTAAYVFGGSTGSSVLDEVVEYNPAADTARKVSATLPKAVTRAAAVWTGSAAYVLGGQTSTGFGGGIADIVKFDPASGTASVASARLPVAVTGHGAAWVGGAAYVFGGMDQFGGVSNRIAKYDPATDTAQLVGTSLPEGLTDLSVATDGTYAYLFGGLTGSFSVQTSVLRFDPAANTVVTMNGAMPFPMNQGVAVHDGGFFYVMGGALDIQNTGSAYVLQYDPVADATTTYDLSLAVPVALASGVWAGDAAYLFGGRDKNQRTDDIQRFVPGEGSPGGAPVGTNGGGSPGIPVDVRGSVLAPGGSPAVGIPILLLALTGGALLPVGGTVTQSDGTFSITQAASQPSHVATYQDGHIILRSLETAPAGQPLDPIPVQKSTEPVAAEDLLTLRSAFEEAKVFPAGTLVSGSPATVDTGGYHGLDRVEVEASGVDLQLVVAKMKSKGLDRVPEPRGDVLRWFGLALIDVTGAEVPVDRARVYFNAPTGVAANASLTLYHLLVLDDGTAWEGAVSTPVGDGLYGVELTSLSLFGVGPTPTTPGINTMLLLAGGGVVAVGLVGVTAWKLRSKRAGAPAASAAKVARPAAMSQPAVEVKDAEFLVAGLSFQADGKKLLQDLSFGFQQGQILALLGPSGSGKSTLLKCIIGENRYGGEISVFGYQPDRDRVALKRLVGYTPQDTQLYPDMTVRENVAYFGKQYGLPKDQLESVVPFLIQTLGLEDRAETPLKVLSGGQQRRASIAATLVPSPALLILDEPTSGLDPITRRNLWKFIRQANRELGVSVIVTTHFLDETEYADRVVILVRGRVVAAGSPQELLRSLPGGGKVVVVELQTTTPAIEKRIREASTSLEKEGLVKKVDITGFTVRFFVENPQAATRPLLDALTNAEVPVKSITGEDGKMEDVFVHYAGEAWKEPTG